MLRLKPSSQDSPWTILVYSDGVTPGNPLAVMNMRKFHAIYWSFPEFGINALSREESWLCAATEYSTQMSEYSAGLSQALAAIIMLFFEDGGTHLAETGVLLNVDGEHTRLYAKIGGVIQDGGAHKSVWHSRGDAASRFCLICKNMFTHASQICDEDGSNMLCCKATKRS